MTYVGIGPNGSRKLPTPVRIKLDWDADAPADAFEGIFPVQTGYEPITRIQVFGKDGEICFDGIVDEQECSLTKGTLTLSARSRAALLLDNEAMPQTYTHPSLAMIFNRHVRPYGFARYLGNARSFDGSMTVNKGMSEWAVAAKFCSFFLKTKARIVNGVFDASGTVPEQKVVFGKGGIRFSSGILKSKYCELYSDLYALNPNGGTYKLTGSSAQAKTLGITRRRFLSDEMSAFAVLKRAEKNAFEVVLDCPGYIMVPLLSPARIIGVNADIWDQTSVVSIRYLLDVGGEHTRITLRRK